MHIPDQMRKIIVIQTAIIKKSVSGIGDVDHDENFSDRF